MEANRLNTQLEVDKDFAQQRNMDMQEVTSYLNAHNARFWSWGAKGFTNVYNKALRFKVNGHHHKGYVYISVSFMDTFDIVFTNSKHKITYIQNDIYIEDLFNLLDEKIEKIPAYGI